MGNRMRKAACIAALLVSTGAVAQAYPTKPVRIVLAYASGGPTEFLARAVGEKASQRLGQPILVEPRPGANERVATEYVSKLPPDGLRCC
jgi:tripartite-type tricarboxylate transporter receptor subunit TctC